MKTMKIPASRVVTSRIKASFTKVDTAITKNTQEIHFKDGEDGQTRVVRPLILPCHTQSCNSGRAKQGLWVQRWVR